MKITVAEAEPFFAHPSQRKAAMLDGPLPDWVDYFTCEGVCGAFHLAHWPGVVMGHIGVKPESWGRTLDPALAVLREAWAFYGCGRILGMVPERNRAMCRFTEKLGFVADGRLPLPDPVMIYGWRL